jgi:predicted short-subunit dehydrogenase-like oxidoreductase (DUF2520 family)
MAESRPAVAIVGAGAVAQALGRLMVAGGERVVAVASRTDQRALAAARFIRDGSVLSVKVIPTRELPRVATRVLIAVSDEAIESVAQTLASSGMRAGTVLHTCGARSPDALRALTEQGVSCGVLHPLQTIMTPEQGVTTLPGATFGLSGDDRAIQWAEEVVRFVAGPEGRSLRIDPDRLSYYHAGAVMASNALVAVLDAAIGLLVEAGVTEDEARRAIAPLARASLANVLSHGPAAALTGPVVRGDAATIAAHVRALNHVEPTVAALYVAAAGHLLRLAADRGLPAARLQAVERELKR